MKPLSITLAVITLCLSQMSFANDATRNLQRLLQESATVMALVKGVQIDHSVKCEATSAAPTEGNDRFEAVFNCGPGDGEMGIEVKIEGNAIDLHDRRNANILVEKISFLYAG